jgi:hypothetical protein
MVGLMMGPAYFIYCTYLSGEAGEQVVMTERAARWTTADGTILHFPKRQAYRPIIVELKPDMNRIKLNLTFTAAEGDVPATRPAPDDYQASVMQGDQQIMHRSLQVQTKPGNELTLSLGTLEVFYPGAYTFVLETPDAPNVALSRVTLSVQHRVEKMVMAVLITGLLVLAVGMAMYIEPYLKFIR